MDNGLGVLAGCGCGKKAAPGGEAAAPAAAVAPFHEAVVARLKDEGFTVGAFAKAAPDAYGARACVRGLVDQLDVLLCEFADAATAQAAEKKLNAFASGAVSGASRRADTISMTVADRAKVDLSGKRISRILRALALPAAPPA
jgi:pyridoxine 5'-phosphate synthase PdxJ